MARNRGTFDFSSNFELLTRAPLDARMVVNTYDELTDPSTWTNPLDGKEWLFDGAIVAVANDASISKRGIYFLNDFGNYENTSSWIKNNIGTVVINDVSNYATTDGSTQAHIFNKIDASGILQFKDIGAAGGISLTENLGTVWISTDASYSGQANIGANLTGGDVSVYQGMSGDTLNFRTLAGSPNIKLTQTDNTITVDVSGNIQGINGGVFITDVVANGDGNISQKVTSSQGIVLDSFVTDISTITVSIKAITGNTNFVPDVLLETEPITLTGTGTNVIFDGDINIDISDMPDINKLTVTHEDGASHFATIGYDTKPIILDASIALGEDYPGIQTEIKSGQTIDITFSTDVSVDEVTINKYGLTANAASPTIFPLTSGKIHTITLTVANNGSYTALEHFFGFSLTVKKSNPSLSVSLPWISDITPDVDLVNVLNVNNLTPTISIGAPTYPAGQQALKDTESSTISNAINYYDALVYSSPNGDLGIGTPTVYQPSLNVTRLLGTSGYNINTYNLRIEASRIANNTTASDEIVVYIADTIATMNVVSQPTRFISYGNDGTTFGQIATNQKTVTINSDQLLLDPPSLATDILTTATWEDSSTFSGGGTSFTNSMRVLDDALKGTFNYSSPIGYNLANIPVNFTPFNYTIGGFVSRTVTKQGFVSDTSIGVPVTTFTKLNTDLNWSGGAADSRQPIGTLPIVSRGWSIDALSQPVTTIIILDTPALNSSTTPTTVTISESA